LLCVQWKIPDDGQRNCPKHVEFYSKNKFEKLVHLFGFIIRIHHDARSPGRQIGTSCAFQLTFCWRGSDGIADSEFQSTTHNNCCIYTEYLLMMGYKYARNMYRLTDEINWGYIVPQICFYYTDVNWPSSTPVQKYVLKLQAAMFTKVNIKITVLRCVTPCTFGDGCQCFERNFTLIFVAWGERQLVVPKRRWDLIDCSIKSNLNFLNVNL